MADLSATGDSVHLIIATSQTFSASQRDHTIGRINRSLGRISESIQNVKDDLNCCLRRQSRDLLAADQEYSLASKQDNKYEFEILVNSSVKTFKQALRTLVHSQAKVKYLVLSTLDVNSNGDLLFQDAAFSVEDLLLALGDEKKEDVKLGLIFSAHSTVKHWKSALDKAYKNVSVQLAADDGLTTAEYDSFLNDLRSYLNEAPVESFMDVSKFTGTLRINRPCLYIFPGKEGDSAYFTINGYSMLVNGGYDRLRPCFWRFVNMLQQIDSVLITHSDADALGGLGSFFAKKLASPDIKPNILSVLGNLVGSSTSKAAHTAASLIASETQAHGSARSDVDTILEAIEKLQIKLVPLVKTNEPKTKYEHVNLYSKLGHGSLDLYILSPFANSKELKDFVQQQLANVDTHFAANKSHLTYKNLLKTVPLSHLNSAVVLVVWLPSYSSTATGNDNNALRLLFTGNAPQHVVFSALEKLKDFDVLQSATYKVKASASVTNNETVFHNLVAGVKKSAAAAASAKANHAASKDSAATAAAPGVTSSPSTDNPSKPAQPKPVHTAKPVSNKPAADSASTAKSADKPPAAPKPVAKPAPTPAAKEPTTSGPSASSKASVKNGHEQASKVPASKPKEAKETKEAEVKKDVEVKKPAPKVAAKPTAAPAKPKEAPKANGSAEANGHAPSKDASKPVANGVTKSAEKPKPAAKPAPKPKEPSTSVPAKKPASGKNDAAAPAKKEKDEASRIITKRNVPNKPAEPIKAEEASVAVALADPVVTSSSAVVDEPAKKVEEVPAANGHHEELINVSKDDVAAPVEHVATHNDSVATEVKELEPEPEVVQDQTSVVELNESLGQETGQNESLLETSEVGQNEPVVQETEQNESLVESVHEGETTAEAQVSSSHVKTEVEESGDSANDFVVVDAHSSDLLNAQLDDLKLDDGHQDVAATEVVSEVNGNGHNGNGFGNGHFESEEVTTKHNGNGLIDFDAPNGDSFGKAKGVVENLINIEGGDQNYEKTVDEAAVHSANFENDPAKWNLLELPKPVIPSDSIVLETQEAPGSANTEKKSAADGKKASLGPEAKDKPVGNKTAAAPKVQAPAAKPVKPSNIHPAYVEVTYIPAHGNSFYVDSEYFKRVRARFYILSTQEPSEALLNAIIEGKEAWEDKSLQMSIIPTYESESLRRWFSANEETLARLKIDIMPAANLATLTMDDNPDLSFQLYKLEF